MKLATQSETVEATPGAEYLAEVVTRLPLTPRAAAQEIKSRGAGLRAISVMRTAPSWWPVLDTHATFYVHLIFDGTTPQLFPMPALIRRLWLVKLEPNEALKTEEKQLEQGVSPPALPEGT